MGKISKKYDAMPEINAAAVSARINAGEKAVTIIPAIFGDDPCAIWHFADGAVFFNWVGKSRGYRYSIKDAEFRARDDIRIYGLAA